MGSATDTWGVDDVTRWLGAVSLESHTETFVAHGITGKDLLDLSHDDLSSMGYDATRCVLVMDKGLTRIAVLLSAFICPTYSLNKRVSTGPNQKRCF